MARPRSIHVCPADLLAGIGQAIQSDLAALDAAIQEAEAAYAARRNRYDSGWHHLCDLRAWRGEIERDGVRYNLERFAGRELTASERIRWQQSVRKIEAAGLVAIDGKKARHVKMTEAGWQALAATSPAVDAVAGTLPKPAPGDAADRVRVTI
jgi:hypothetical protein